MNLPVKIIAYDEHHNEVTEGMLAFESYVPIPSPGELVTIHYAVYKVLRREFRYGKTSNDVILYCEEDIN